MNVLVLEDDENKSDQLGQFIRAAFPELRLTFARSLISGIRALTHEKPDLVLLDMTIPNYDVGPDEEGGTPYIFGGREFLQELDRYGLTVPVIVVTQFEQFGKDPPKDLVELDKELKSEFPATYRGAVYYHAAIHEWQPKLTEMICTSIGLRHR